MRIKHRLLAATILLILGVSLAFTAVSCVREQRALLLGLDEKLDLAARLASQSLPENYHDRITDAHSVSPEEYAHIAEKYNKVCLDYGLQYLWSCMAVGDRIVFTTATSPSKMPEKRDYAAFFSEHSDPGAFAGVFRTMKTDHSSFQNEWGKGRMVLIPAVDSNGRRYCFGASMSYDAVRDALHRTLRSAFVLGAWVLAAGVVGSIALSSTLTRPILRLTQAADSIAHGDMDREIRTGGGKELVSLGKSIAVMRDAIRDTISKLKTEIGERRRTEEQLRSISSAAQDAVIMMDDRGCISFWNEAAARMFGYASGEVIGRDLHGLLVPGRYQASVHQALEEFQAGRPGNGVGRLTELTALRKNGDEFPVELSLATVRQGGCWNAVGIVRDITERKAAEEALKRANRALLVDKEGAEALARAGGEEELLKRICQIVVEIGGAKMAWVGFAEDDECKTVRPVARAGDDTGYLSEIEVRWDESALGQGPVGTAIRTRDVSISRDIAGDPCMAPWRRPQMERGYSASIALPLVCENRCLGALTIYAGEPDAFNGEEVRLLRQLAGDLSYGIISLRTRAERSQLQQEMISISERAKRMIAQELHDGLCQHLAGTAMMASLLHRRLVQSGSPEADHANEICGLLSTSVQEARNLAHGLHPVKSEPTGLMDALTVMAGSVTKLFHVRCSLRCATPVYIDNEVTATHLFRIAQESVNNAMKHGQADRVVIGLFYAEDGLVLAIRDNGVGIAPDPPASGMGMQIMRHRASLIGATVTVRRAGKRGTLVRCLLPFTG